MSRPRVLFAMGERASTGAEISSAFGMRLAQGGQFSCRVPQPHILFRLGDPLEPGWWRIRATIDGRGKLHPSLSFRFDDGYGPNQRAWLAPRGCLAFEGFAHVGAPVSEIRFDPAGRGGAEGILERLELRRMISPALALGRPAVLRGLRHERRARQLARRLLRPHEDSRPWGMPVWTRTPSAPPSDKPSYEQWIAEFDYDPDTHDPVYRNMLAALPVCPLISVLMPVYRTPLGLLDAAIESVRGQIYDNWELCIADDASGDDELSRKLQEWARRDPRIRVAFREHNGNIAAATNTAFALARGEFVALLDHDDVLRRHALAEVALALAAQPDAQIIYSDEDKIDETGTRRDPYFKPDFSLHLLLGQNYFNHLTVHRAENVRAAAGWREGFEGSQDYDLNLRILRRTGGSGVLHIPKVLYHWRAVAGSTALAASEKSHAFNAGLRALEEYVSHIDPRPTVGQAGSLPFYHVTWPLPEPAPTVSVIVPTRDRADLLSMCVNSIRERTDYPNYEILVIDNGSRESATFDLFDWLKQDTRVRILSYDKPFNFSAINNFAVSHARGALVCLVNNDVEVIAGGWLREMAGLAIRPETGCVGAKLYYPNDTIQHGGITLGIGGVAGHSHKYLPRETEGYFGRMHLTHEVSAVTGACLLVRRSIYEEVGGLNERDLAVAFNDVDFCLKVRRAGYLNLWTPRAELYHHESISRGHEDNPEKLDRFAAEIAYMQEHWSDELVSDPYYSPNLSTIHEDYRLRMS